MLGISRLTWRKEETPSSSAATALPFNKSLLNCVLNAVLVAEYLQICSHPFYWFIKLFPIFLCTPLIYLLLIFPVNASSPVFFLCRRLIFSSIRISFTRSDAPHLASFAQVIYWNRVHRAFTERNSISVDRGICCTSSCKSRALASWARQRHEDKECGVGMNSADGSQEGFKRRTHAVSAKVFPLHKDFSSVDVIGALVFIWFGFQQCFSGCVCVHYIKCLLFSQPFLHREINAR